MSLNLLGELTMQRKKGFVLPMNYIVLLIIMLVVIFGLVLVLSRTNSKFLTSANSVIKGSSSALSSKKSPWVFWGSSKSESKGTEEGSDKGTDKKGGITPGVPTPGSPTPPESPKSLNPEPKKSTPTNPELSWIVEKSESVEFAFSSGSEEKQTNLESKVYVEKQNPTSDKMVSFTQEISNIPIYDDNGNIVGHTNLEYLWSPSGYPPISYFNYHVIKNLNLDNKKGTLTLTFGNGETFKITCGYYNSDSEYLGGSTPEIIILRNFEGSKFLIFSCFDKSIDGLASGTKELPLNQFDDQNPSNPCVSSIANSRTEYFSGNVPLGHTSYICTLFSDKGEQNGKLYLLSVDGCSQYVEGDNLIYTKKEDLKNAYCLPEKKDSEYFYNDIYGEEKYSIVKKSYSGVLIAVIGLNGKKYSVLKAALQKIPDEKYFESYTKEAKKEMKIKHAIGFAYAIIDKPGTKTALSLYVVPGVSESKVFDTIINWINKNVDASENDVCGDEKLEEKMINEMNKLYKKNDISEINAIKTILTVKNKVIQNNFPIVYLPTILVCDVTITPHYTYGGPDNSWMCYSLQIELTSCEYIVSKQVLCKYGIVKNCDEYKSNFYWLPVKDSSGGIYKYGICEKINKYVNYVYNAAKHKYVFFAAVPSSWNSIKVGGLINNK